MGIEIKDTSPWKDIVDFALDDQYNNSGGGAGGGGGSSGGGGAGGEIRPPTLEERQQLLNQAARPVTNSYNVSRGSADRNPSGQIFRDQNQYHFYNNLLNNNDNGVRQWAQRQLDEGNYFVRPSSYTPGKYLNLNDLSKSNIDPNQVDIINAAGVNTLSPEFGKPISTKEQLKNLSDLELVARVIYGEQTKTKEKAQEAVAWTIINRSKQRGQSYREVVLAPFQYTAVDMEEGNPQAYEPMVNTLGWENAVRIATYMVNDRTDGIVNPIGRGMYYRSTSYFNKHSKKDPNNEGIIFEGHYVKDINDFNGNTFFNYGK